MKRVKRHDAGRFDKLIITDQGFLKADVYATRAGIFTYQFADGTKFKELRPIEEVFNKESMASLEEVCITDDHPQEPVTADNAVKYAKGWTGKGSKMVEENHLSIPSTIMDAETIRKIESGKQEVSCGYFCDLDFTPGEWNGEKYDAIQRNIIYNHLAIVNKGRAGPKARIKMDADEAFLIEDSANPCANFRNSIHSENKEEKIIMSKIKIDSVEYEVSDGIAPVIVSKLDENTSLKKEIEEAKKALEAAQGRADALDAEIKKKDSEIESMKKAALDDKAILSKAESLKKVHDFAKKILGDEFKSDSSINEIKRQCVGKILDTDVSSKEDSYIDGVFDAKVTLDSKESDKTLKDEIANKTEVKDSAISAEQVRAKRMKEDQEAYKK